MTVAELFIKLGFKIEGRESFDKAVSQLGFGEVKAINLKHALVGLGAGMTALMYFAANAATGLYKFHMTTGLSTKSLQEWQFAGARANVAAGEITNTIKGIQAAQADIALGQGNIAPWALLGLDPKMDPFQVLWQIHQRIKETGGLAPGLARSITGQLGISQDMFQFLRRDNLELGQLKDKFVQSADAQKRLDELNGRWRQMSYELEQVGIEVGDALGPKFMALIRAAVPWIEKAADWLTKLASNTPDGERMRKEFSLIATGVFAAAAAFTALGAALKLYATAAAASTVIKTLAGLGGGAAAAGGATAAATGGGAAAASSTAAAAGGTGLGTVLAPVLGFGGIAAVLGALPLLLSQIYRLKDPTHPGEGVASRFLRVLNEGDTKLGGTFGAKSFFLPGWMMKDASDPTFADHATRRAARDGPTTITVVVHQNIDGSGDPVAVGREAANQIKQVIKSQNAAFTDQGAAASGVY